METHFTATRARAYELADTGGFTACAEIARALTREGFGAGDIKRLEYDSLAQLMLMRRIERARERQAPAASPGAGPCNEPFLHPSAGRVWWEWDVTGDLHEPILVVETTLLAAADSEHHLSAPLLEQLAAAARDHFRRFDFAVDRVRLVPSRDT